VRDRFSSAIALENARGLVAVIPDIKCISPKDGDLLRGRNAVAVSRQLVSYGAPLLSVVTEREHFGGSPKLLFSVTQAVEVPVLRKDFVTSVDMLQETVDLGASAVLLICAITDEKTLALLYEKAIDLGLEPLVEVSSEKEMRLASRLEARLIGINNRDITAFERDGNGPQRTIELAKYAPKGALLISESGIMSSNDAKRVASAGVSAILVGTILWQARDMGEMYRLLQVERSIS